MTKDAGKRLVPIWAQREELRKILREAEERIRELEGQVAVMREALEDISHQFCAEREEQAHLNIPCDTQGQCITEFCNACHAAKVLQVLDAADAGRRVAEDLTFVTLRAVNVRRCESSFHAVDSWSPADWAMAMAGECGEACNVVKKLRRLQDGKQLANIPTDRSELVQALGDELADTIIYADLLAARLGIDLGAAVVRKFNAVSDRVGSTIKLAALDAAREGGA